jgi:hypothetical protein
MNTLKTQISQDAQGLIKLINVRLCYPNIYKYASFKGKNLMTFDLTVLIPKTEVQVINQLRQMLINCATLPDYNLSERNSILHDGDLKNSQGSEFKGCYYLKLKNKDQPNILNSDGRTPVEEFEGLFHGGCFISVGFRLWFQNNDYGVRVNANLLVVKFESAGKKFGTASLDSSEFLASFATATNEPMQQQQAIQQIQQQTEYTPPKLPEGRPLPGTPEHKKWLDELADEIAF